MSASIQDLDGMFASHFGSIPLIADNKVRSSTSSFESGSDENEPCTLSYSRSINSQSSPKTSQKEIDPERAAKLQLLYSTLAELYVGDHKEQKQEEIFPSSVDSSNVSFHRDSAHKMIPKSSMASLDIAGASLLVEEEENEELADLSPTSLVFPMSKRKRGGIAGLPSGFDMVPNESNDGARLRESRSTASLDSHFRSRQIHVEDAGQSSEARGSSLPRQAPAPTSLPQADLRVLLLLQEIVFKVATLPDEEFEEEARDILAKRFPQLCEIPTRMLGENGELLPPTKKEETTPEERKARNAALHITLKGQKMHSLIKSMAVLESRSAMWKRIGSAKLTEAADQELPLIPDPWGLECYHQDLDKFHHDGKAKRSFELKDSRIEGLCPTCKGRGLDACSTCKGEDADECWWCSGTGKKKNLRACERCLREGKLKCQACNGRLIGTCEPCKGEGHGLYAAMVHIKVRHVEFPPVPTPVVVDDSLHDDPAAIRRTKTLIDRLVSTSIAKEKSPFRSLTASCSWEISSSKLIEVEVPQTFKPLTKKLGMALGLRRSMSGNSIKHKKNATSLRHFMLPSDPHLRPAEMSKEEFSAALLPEVAIIAARQGNDYEILNSSKQKEDIASSINSTAPVFQAFKPTASPILQMAFSPSTSATVSPILSPDREFFNAFEEMAPPSDLGSHNSFDSLAPRRPARSHRRTGSTPVQFSLGVFFSPILHLNYIFLALSRFIHEHNLYTTLIKYLSSTFRINKDSLKQLFPMHFFFLFA